MNSQNAVGTATIASDQILAPVAPAAAAGAAAAAPTSRAPYGKAHAVPVGDLVGSSNWLVEAIYRGAEIVVASIGLIVGLPLILIQAILIRLDSPGPVLFFQKRLSRSAMVRGRDLEGRADLIAPPGGYDPDTLYYVPSYFRFVKFRTMYHDAKTRFPELYAYKFAPGEFHQRYFKEEDDPRVTRIGRILRKLTIDELPNLWCVLVGDMRLVGPRPEIPEVVQYYTPEQMYKFAAAPGITGLAQINGRGLLSWGETLAWDLKYVHTRNEWLDIRIILTTLKYLVKRRGAF